MDINQRENVRVNIDLLREIPALIGKQDFTALIRARRTA
jgi:hypothetical protein